MPKILNYSALFIFSIFYAANAFFNKKFKILVLSHLTDVRIYGNKNVTVIPVLSHTIVHTHLRYINVYMKYRVNAIYTKNNTKKTCVRAGRGVRDQ